MYVCMLHEYHVLARYTVFSVRYYPRFSITAVGLGTYNLRIRRSAYIQSCTNDQKPQSLEQQSGLYKMKSYKTGEIKTK